MSQQEWLADRFEDHRAHLHSVAYRMLGSSSEADDAVQEAWLRASRAGTEDVQNLRAWLTTIVARVSLDALRSRKARPVEPLDVVSEAPSDETPDPAREVEIADSVGLAMLVVLETLTPAERLAFVLHDMFAVPFEEIAPIVGRTPTAARQLASRARRRVQGASSPGEADRARQREVITAFLAASREGNFERLLALLDPSVILRADPAAMAMGAATYFGEGLSTAGEISGPHAVAQTFAGRARAAQLALVDGDAAAVWRQGGQLRVVFSMTVVDGRIARIELVADPERLSGMDVEVL